MTLLRTPEIKWSWYVFLIAGAFVLWTAGARFILANNDEGIYLASAMRMLRGELPYRDFFYYLPPGTPLIESGVLRLFGERLWVARIPLAVDIAILTASVFWLTARLANLRAAFITAFCFLAFETAEHDRLVVDHRWDSSAWATLAVALTVSLMLGESGNWRLRSVLVGASAALAGWITTPVALVGVVIFGAAFIVPRLRRSAIWIGTGAAGCSACFLGWLAAHHNLAAALDGVLWPASHYGSANRTAYGWVIGGYANLFQGLTVGGAITVAIFLLFLTLPATLPVLALTGWPIRLRLESEDRRWAIGLMLLSMIALMVSTLPRPDLIHLMYVSGIAYALCVALAVRVLPPRVLALVTITMLLMAGAEYAIAINRRIGEPAMATRLGVVRGTESDLNVLRLVTSHVRPEDGFFAFPYWPNFYLFSGARNPTRFAYLQPGMFSADDEHLALQELQASPPRWILYVDTPPEAYLRIWPGSDRARLRFSSIEDFIAGHYRVAGKVDAFELRERQ